MSYQFAYSIRAKLRWLYSYYRRYPKRTNTTVCAIVTLWFYFSACWTHLFTTSFDQFQWPIKGINVSLEVQKLMNGSSTLNPIHFPNVSYSISPISQRCHVADKNDIPLLLFAIKSAPDHFARRNSIRKTWGMDITFCMRTAYRRCYTLNRVFFIGKTANRDKQIDDEVRDEAEEFGDIALANTEEGYFKLTGKVLGALHWIATTACSKYKYTLIVDDDSHISVPNLIAHLYSTAYSDSVFLGYMHPSGLPQRCVSHREPYKVTLGQYPFRYYPAFITTGALLLSQKVLQYIYYASYITEPFIFDDVYLGIIAHRLGLSLQHNKYFVSIHRSDPIGKYEMNDPETFHQHVDFHKLFSYDSLPRPEAIVGAFETLCHYYKLNPHFNNVAQTYIDKTCANQKTKD